MNVLRLMLSILIFINIMNLSSATDSEIIEQYPYGVNSTIYIYIDTEDVPNDWVDDYYNEVLRALLYWTKGNGDLSYTPRIRYTNDSALQYAYDYDITIKWIDKFEKDKYDEGIGGVALHEVGNDGKWNTIIFLAIKAPISYYSDDTKIKYAEIYEPISKKSMYYTARHELGHAYGLGHSNNSSDTMYYKYYEVTSLSNEELLKRDKRFLIFFSKIILTTVFLIVSYILLNNSKIKIYNAIDNDKTINNYLKIKDKRELFKRLLIDNSFNDYKILITPEYLFSWDNIQKNDCRTLIKFLNGQFDIDWVKTAKIEKIDDNKTIKVYTKKNYLLLTLNDEKTRVDIKIDDVRVDKFIVKTEYGRLNIYNEANILDYVLDKIFEHPHPFDTLHAENVLNEGKIIENVRYTDLDNDLIALQLLGLDEMQIEYSSGYSGSEIYNKIKTVISSYPNANIILNKWKILNEYPKRYIRKRYFESIIYLISCLFFISIIVLIFYKFVWL